MKVRLRMTVLVLAAPLLSSLMLDYEEIGAGADRMRRWLDAARPAIAASVDEQGGAGCLEVESSFLSVNTAHSLIARDLNEDGHLDLAVVAHRPIDPGEALGIFLGDGAGGFTPFEFLPVGDHNHGIIAVDVNHDGHLDLVTSTADASNPRLEINVVHTYLGDGTGRFPRHDRWPVERDLLGPLDVQAADLNHDGHLDLVVAGAGFGDVAVLLGDGRGGFGSPRFFRNVVSRTRATVVADFDGDGLPDVVASNRVGNSVSLLLGDGTGALAFSRTFPVKAGPRTLVQADFNRDGRPDIAVTSRGAAVVSVLLGDGRGGFAPARHVPVGEDPRSIAARDFNDDGWVDLAVTSNGSQTVSLLYGDGSGNFSEVEAVRVGDGPLGRERGGGFGRPGEGRGLVGLEAADVDHNGTLELLVTSTFEHRVYVLKNRCQHMETR